jgi:hypothetical protein
MLRSRKSLAVRRGIATLELVLIFPTLMGLLYFVFLVARADVYKVGTVTAARQQAWQKRPNAAAAGPLSLNQNPQGDEINGSSLQPLAMGPLFGGQTQNAVSQNTLVANTWATPTVPFQSLPQNLSPHTTEMRMIVNLPWDTIFGGLTMLFDPGSNPGMITASALGQAANIGIQIDGATLDYIDGGALRLARGGLEIALAIQEATLIGCAFDACKPMEEAIAILSFAITTFHNLNEAANGRPGDGTPSLDDFFGL